MPLLLRNLTLLPGESEDTLKDQVLRRFSIPFSRLSDFRLLRKGIDARRKRRIHYVCTVSFSVPDESEFLERHSGDPDLSRVEEEREPLFPRLSCAGRIAIVGMGPAGLFAALRLAEYGLTAVIFERGRRVDERVRDVERFWSCGELKEESNVQFGEGGAGTFSDGKLTTRVRDLNIAYVLEKFVRFGAPPETLYLAKPHIGTDRLRGVVRGIREHLLASGFDIRFGGKLTDIAAAGGRLSSLTINDAEELSCDALILAPGHSARDTYAMLRSRTVLMERKPFALGLRVEHPQELINRIQYGADRHPALPPADYALAYNDPKSGRSAYSFCMCPGGAVVAGSSEAGGVVTNGMSPHLRNSPYANSALVVNVRPDDFDGNDPLAGVEFQRFWERKAFEAGGGGYMAPAQNLMAFMGEQKGFSCASSYRPGVREHDLSLVLPTFVSAALRDGIRFFDRKMRGFMTREATLTGVETRTSAPLRIVRGHNMQSVSMAGLYPVGEGAGYAGGIMSAALDGIRAADAVALGLQ